MNDRDREAILSVTSGLMVTTVIIALWVIFS